jgi:hypothetical protein
MRKQAVNAKSLNRTTGPVTTELKHMGEEEIFAAVRIHFNSYRICKAAKQVKFSSKT